MMMHLKPIACWLVVMMWAVVGHADSIRLSGIWYDGITIQGFDHGRVVFHTAGGREVSQDLIKLQAIKISTLPQVEKAIAAMEAGDFRAAAQALTQAQRSAKPDWLKQYLNWNLVKAYNPQGQGLDAVRAYLALVQGGADPFFLEEPPIEAAARSSPKQKEAIRSLIAPVRQRVDPASMVLLDALMHAADPGAATPSHVDAGAARVPDGAVTLPVEVDRANPVAQALLAGEFEQALQLADAQLEQAGGLSAKLYLHGRAVLALAEQRGDLAWYKTAGLSFARVMIYFPKSSFAGPAMLELGYIHQKIGQPDKAHALYQRALVQIDQEHDPAYHQRMMRLIEEQTSSDDDAVTSSKGF